MKLAMVSFTNTGDSLGARLTAQLAQTGHEAVHTPLRASGIPLARWAENSFPAFDGLIFIGAAGIAVRAVAPYLKSKATDPAVVVLDEQARHVIPLVSGHMGGANALALLLAKLCGAEPVITTATDLSGVFAVDSWAISQNLCIQNPERIKAVSAKLLAGEDITLQSDIPIAGKPPRGVLLCGESGDVVISCKRPKNGALHLVPLLLTLGLGCRKNTAAADIGAAVQAVLEQENIVPQAVCRVCSIALKAEEPGLLEFCAGLGLEPVTFTAEELARVEGDFTASAFVKNAAGVDNVCERAAVRGSGGRLLVKKQVQNGVTVAVAAADFPLVFP